MPGDDNNSQEDEGKGIKKIKKIKKVVTGPVGQAPAPVTQPPVQPKPQFVQPQAFSDPRPQVTQPPAQAVARPPVPPPSPSADQSGERPPAKADGLIPDETDDGKAATKIRKIKKVVSDGPSQAPAVPVMERIGASSSPGDKLPPMVSRSGMSAPQNAVSISDISAQPANAIIVADKPKTPFSQGPSNITGTTMPKTPGPTEPAKAITVEDKPKTPVSSGIQGAQKSPPVTEPAKAITVEDKPASRSAPANTSGSVAANPRSVEYRLSAIDIDKLTDELEKDILSTLSSEIEGILDTTSAPKVPPAEKKEVREEPKPPQTAPASLPASQMAMPVSKPRAESPPPSQDQKDNEQRERRVAYRLGREFDKLPTNMRNELLKTLARTDDVKVREDVVIAIASNFEKLPPEIRVLFRTLAGDRDSRVREEVAFELNRSYNRIAPEVRNDLIPLLVKDVDVRVREDIVAAITSFYDRNPPAIQDLLKALASDRKSSVRDQVTHEVLRNADRIPEAVRSEISRLIDRAATAYSRERD